ncbi:MAG: zinc ribbon domain-containing protein [Desulfococcaceae bacterium]|nr:zinc ribbon domain-containing protein [Desulfococcaceae bacterium]
MPIYEFECRKCRHCFEKLMFASDENMPECPECHGRDVSRLMSAGFVRPRGIPSGSGGFTPPPKACASGGG